MAGQQGSVAERLRRVDWARHGVVYVVLFGSAARGDSYEDVDLAVLFEKPPDLETLAKLAEEIAATIGLPEDRVDIVVLNNEDLPCTLILEALGKGVPVYYQDMEAYIEDALRRLKLCWDFEISYRKLDLLETAIAVVKESWES